jgi:hypothetical protein
VSGEVVTVVTMEVSGQLVATHHVDDMWEGLEFIRGRQEQGFVVGPKVCVYYSKLVCRD